MYSFAEWLQKNHGVVIEDLRERTRGEGDPLRRKPAAETPEQEAEKRAEDREKKKLAQARTRGHGTGLYARLRGK